MRFTLNGKRATVDAHPMRRLLDVLREDCGLTGTKEGCGEGECGACSVLVDDSLVLSCLVPVGQVQGTNVVTIEGITADARFHTLQEKFLECGAAQCGICTPGMILASVHLLNKKPRPTMEEIRELQDMGVHAAIGMAIYTGRLDLAQLSNLAADRPI